MIIRLNTTLPIMPIIITLVTVITKPRPTTTISTASSRRELEKSIWVVVILGWKSMSERVRVAGFKWWSPEDDVVSAAAMELVVGRR